MSVADILTFYEDAGADMFTKANILKRLRYKFESEPLALKLQEVFRDKDATLGSDDTTHASAAGDAQRHDRFALAVVEQSTRQVQRSGPRRQQPEFSAMAARPCQHRGADLFPARGHPAVQRGQNHARRNSSSSMAASRCTTTPPSRCF